MVLALNMMDEVRENGGSIRVNDLERQLGIPVVPISAIKNEGHRRAGGPRRPRGSIPGAPRPDGLLFP